MSNESLAQQADRLSRRRARILPFLAVIYLTQQVSFFSQTPSERLVDHVKIGAWVVLSLVLLAALTTKGFWLRNAELRSMIDDETTRANRGSAQSFGFLFAMLTAILLYFVDQFSPVTAREAVHVIVSLGIGAALIRFGILEGRGLRDA
jgi:hypothetical protein